MRPIYFVALIASVAAFAGCNSVGSQPHLERAQIFPAYLTPGDTALITVEPRDKDGIIHRIEGRILEDPRMPLHLNDEGRDGDEVAGDGVWSLQVDVPPPALGGTYTVEFTAYRRDGTAVPIRDKEGNVSPLTTIIPIQINAAPESTEEAAE